MSPDSGQNIQRDMSWRATGYGRFQPGLLDLIYYSYSLSTYGVLNREEFMSLKQNTPSTGHYIY